MLFSKRIRKVYNKQATVIYPPVDVERFTFAPEKEEFYLTASRLVPYKKIHLIVEAFTLQPDKKLIVIGEGPDYHKIKTIATSNITLLGYQPFEVLKSHLQRAKAFVFAAEEDFGIAPVEAQACGTPVIAYGKGGACETVIDGKTGILFKEQSVASLTAAVQKFESMCSTLNPMGVRENAERFSNKAFHDAIVSFIDSKLKIKDIVEDVVD